MAVKLHRCPRLWAKVLATSVLARPEGARRHGRRVRDRQGAVAAAQHAARIVIDGTGQSAVPAIELEDGTWYREQSAEMERAIRAGRLGSADLSGATLPPLAGL